MNVSQTAAFELQSKKLYCRRLQVTEGEELPLRVYEARGITLNPLMYIIISTTVNFFGGVIIIKTGSGDFSGALEMI